MVIAGDACPGYGRHKGICDKSVGIEKLCDRCRSLKLRDTGIYILKMRPRSEKPSPINKKKKNWLPKRLGE